MFFYRNKAGNLKPVMGQLFKEIKLETPLPPFKMIMRCLVSQCYCSIVMGHLHFVNLNILSIIWFFFGHFFVNFFKQLLDPVKKSLSNHVPMQVTNLRPDLANSSKITKDNSSIHSFLFCNLVHSTVVWSFALCIFQNALKELADPCCHADKFVWILLKNVRVNCSMHRLMEWQWLFAIFCQCMMGPQTNASCHQTFSQAIYVS